MSGGTPSEERPSSLATAVGRDSKEERRLEEPPLIFSIRFFNICQEEVGEGEIIVIDWRNSKQGEGGESGREGNNGGEFEGTGKTKLSQTCVDERIREISC